MAPIPAASREFYAAQQRLIVATLGLTRAAWSRMVLDDLDGSWARIAPTLTAVVASAQEGAARNGAAYVAGSLEEAGTPVAAVAAVQPRAFSGYAADGRPLTSLLEGAKVYAKGSQSLTAAGTWLDMVAHTAVQDAGRQAAGVDMFTRPRVGWVRAVNPPCCQRCAVLAGRFQKSDVAFPRHPRCDCYAVPSTEGANHPDVVIGPDQVKDLTKAQRDAIADGADMNQVINSHRAGARSKNRLYTTEGATRRGVAGKRLGAAKGKRAARLTPEGIYRQAAGNRDEALRLLRAHGYVL